MRIAVVGPTYPYKGGGAHHTTELAHRLAAAGHEVTLESWKAQYPRFLYPGRQTIDAPEGPPFPGTRHALAWYRPDGWVRLGRRLRGHDLVVFALLTPVQVPAYLGMLTGLRRGARAVALCHNVMPHERKPYDAPLMRALLSRVDGALVHSDEQGALARELAPSTPVRIAELPVHLPYVETESAADRPGDPPASSKAFESSKASEPPVSSRPSGSSSPSGSSKPSKPSEPSVSFELAVSSEPPERSESSASREPSKASEPSEPSEPSKAFEAAEPSEANEASGSYEPFNRLLFFGMVRPYKGLDVLLHALAEVEGPSLTVAGEFWGGERETRELIASLGLDDRVELRPGYVPAAEVPGLFATADALVLPYRSATASQNVFMAWEHGIPVIATRAGALAAHVRDGEDGILCDPDDVGSLAAGLRRFYAPGEPARLRAAVKPIDPEPQWTLYLDRLLLPTRP